MRNRSVLIVLGLVLAVFVVLSVVFQSTDPGVRGIVADVSFFGFALLTLFFIVTGVVALVRRVRHNRKENEV